MCLAIPGKVLEIQTDAHGVRMGKTNFGGIIKQVCLEYTPEVSLGDYVLVHVGFALQKVDEAEAERTYQLLAEMNQLGELDPPQPPPGFDPPNMTQTAIGTEPAARAPSPRGPRSAKRSPELGHQSGGGVGTHWAGDIQTSTPPHGNEAGPKVLNNPPLRDAATPPFP